MLRSWLVGVLVAAMVIGFAGGARSQNAPSTGALEEIQKRGTLRVAVTPTLPPWAMRAKNGDIIGFEIDVAKRLAEDMGVKLELVPSVWDGLIPGLLAGKSDVIISTMTMTPARNLTINFTNSYESGEMQLAASRKLAAKFKTYEDFNKPGVTIAAMRGSTTATAAKRFMPKATVREFEDEALMVQEVVNGRAHAFLATAPRPAFEVLAHKDALFQPVVEPLLRSSEAMGIRKGDPDYLNFLNNWIYLRTRDGWLPQRHDYWLKTREWADQVAPTQ